MCVHDGLLRRAQIVVVVTVEMADTWFGSGIHLVWQRLGLAAQYHSGLAAQYLCSHSTAPTALLTHTTAVTPHLTLDLTI